MLGSNSPHDARQPAYSEKHRYGTFAHYNRKRFNVLQHSPRKMFPFHLIELILRLLDATAVHCVNLATASGEKRNDKMSCCDRI